MHPNLLAIDFETTGLIAGHHGIVSIGLSHSSGAKQHWRVIPHEGAVIDPGALAKNGYSEELWQDLGAQPMSVVMREVVAFIDALPDARHITPLAHNSGFDRGWIDFFANYTGIPHRLNRRWACSQASMQFAIDAGLIDAGSCSLDALCTAAGIRRECLVHHAGEDADLCLLGYLWLIQQAQPPSLLPRLLRFLRRLLP